MICRFFTLLFLTMAINGVAAEGLYSNCCEVVSLCDNSRYCLVENVEDMGFEPEVYTCAVFRTAVEYFSNNWQRVTNEWPRIRNEYKTRVVFGELIGFTGTNAFFGIINAMITDAQTNAVTKKVLPNCVYATTSPMNTYMVYHYAEPSVSNIFLRLISLYDDTPMQKQSFKWCLSGETMRHYEDRRAVEEAEH